MFRKVLVGLLLALVVVTVFVWRMSPLTLVIGSGQIALVQNGVVQETIISTSSPIPAILPAASTAGTALLLAIGTGNPGAAPSITGMPVGWVKLTDATAASATLWQFWIYPNNPGGILAVSPTANCGVAGARWWTHMSEWSGVVSASYLDASGTATATAGTTLVPTTVAALVATKSLVIAGWMQQIAGSATVNFTSPTGFTRLIDTSALTRFQHLDIEYMTNPTPGAILGVTLTSDTTTTQAAGGVIVLTPQISTTDQTAYLQYGSVTEKQNTADFSLLLGGKYELEDGSGGYLLEDGSGYYLLDTYVPTLGDPVAFTNPTWNGRVVDVTKADLVDRLTNYQLATVAATNQTVAGVTTPPGDFADVLTGGKYELEDGSGGYLLEDGSGYYLLEGTSFSYRGLSVKSTQNIDGSVTTYGMLTAFEPGFAAGQTFNLTNANLGYVAQPFLITNVTTTFVGANPPTPEYLIEFGSAYLTLQTSGGGVLTTLGTQAATQAGIVSPGGTLGYAQVTANQGTFTAITDLTGLTVTVTVAAGRRIKITGEAALGSSVSTDTMRLYIRENGTTLQFSYIPGGPATCLIECDLTPSAGVHTYNLSADCNAGSGNITMFAGATQPAFVKVEDIGT